ncbi:hypothetical protein TRFO_38805 [Tritrichomonas foetus]|uniref:UDENN domain-containing protein n=1 Tax=Tritrichomonas foetus TaxID=1144522 RepID=A0A1J4J6X6_9EUKA|nr:hypothetical protein TRFO_38805 [Tritrichomonas foetus]|eukprot:OHS94990.1 hypothetical protein TRFO_38805 [Tritrichomonas foetus]
MKSPVWDVQKFEKNLSRDILNRKNFGGATTNSAFEASTLFDQFFIIGVPPSGTKKSAPQILVAYPPFELPNIPIPRIIEQCFPTSIDRTFLQSGTSHIIQDEFVFQFQCGPSKIYGFCVHVNPKTSSQLPFFTSKNTKKMHFCFCMLSQIPVFSTHLTFLTYLSLSACGKVTTNPPSGVNHSNSKKDYNLSSNANPGTQNNERRFNKGLFPIRNCNSMTLKNPLKIDRKEISPALNESAEELTIDMSFGTPINGLDLTHQIGHHTEIQVPPQIERELAKYYKMTLNSPPVSLAPGFELNFPPLSVLDKSVLWASIDTLFSLLHVKDIVTVLSGLILDAQVLVVGSRLQEVTMSIYALQSLLTPFNFSGTVFPVLPADGHYFDLLQLPTPFLFGIAPCPQIKKTKFLESCYIINLDKKNVSSNDYYPPYPSLEQVVQNIQKIINESKHAPTAAHPFTSSDNTNSPFGGSVVENPFAFPEYFTKYLNHKTHLMMQGIDAILMELHEPLKPALTDFLMSFFVTDAEEGITVFNQELFLASVEPKDQKFFEFLMESQSFQDFIEVKLSAFMKQKGETTNPSRSRKSSFSGVKTRRRRSATRTQAVKLDESDESDTDMQPNNE